VADAIDALEAIDSVQQPRSRFHSPALQERICRTVSTIRAQTVCPDDEIQCILHQGEVATTEEGPIAKATKVPFPYPTAYQLIAFGRVIPVQVTPSIDLAAEAEP